jgi:hypothetical protein
MLKLELAKDLQRRFPGLNRDCACLAIEDLARKTAQEIMLNLLPCREQSLALTKLEEAVLWAHIGIEKGKGEGKP